MSSVEATAEGVDRDAGDPATSIPLPSVPSCNHSSVPPTAEPPGSAPAKRLRVLCTGGLGYIGSHTVLPLIAAGYAVCVVDSLHNATEEVIARLHLLVKEQQQEKRQREQQTQQQQQQEDSGNQQVELQNQQRRRQRELATAAAGCRADADMECSTRIGETAAGISRDGTASATGGDGDVLLEFVKLDMRDLPALLRLFQEKKFAAVIHYAGLKSSAESIQKPLDYYTSNVGGTLNLLQAMRSTGCRILVFSSSATVYQALPERPLREDDARAAGHPYGRSKLIIEQILEDLHAGEERDCWKIAILRYFNPIGAHASGLLGEHPCGIPQNLVPYIQQVAIRKLPHLNIYGADYGTRDGTGVRDYLHVEDLAQGHVAALQQLEKAEGEEEKVRNGTGDDEEKDAERKRAQGKGCLHVYNLGTGRGVSTLEMVKIFEEASGQRIPYRVVGRRPGDLASVVADPSKAEKHLCWKARRSVHDALASAWKWQSMNPNGYNSKSSNSSSGNCWSNGSSNGCSSSSGNCWSNGSSNGCSSSSNGCGSSSNGCGSSSNGCGSSSNGCGSSSNGFSSSSKATCL